MQKRNYDFVASIGEVCACAGILNNLSLRQESSPFDWVGCIEFKQRIEFILNGFKDFVGKEHLQFKGIVPHEPAKAQYVHTVYGTLFIHDFPSAQPLEKSWPTVHAKYERRARRFLEHLRTDRVLLVYIIHGDLKPQPLELLAKYMAQINQKYNTNKIDLLYILHNPALSMKDTVQKTADHVHYVEINNTPTMLTDEFLKLQGNIPIVSDVICHDVLNKSYQDYITVLGSRKRQILFSLARFVSCFCIFTEQRKDMRRYLFRKIMDWIS